MNRRIVFYTLGQIALVNGALLALPAVVALVYREEAFISFAITIAATVAAGLLLKIIAKPSNKLMYAREGFAIVSLAWLYMSAIGALPFVLSGEIPSFADSFFETVSGFTTTGASILTNVEVLSRSILFWRSLTHWIGGMGVLVFVMAILPNTTDRTMHILRAEMPGPVKGKLVPKASETAKILYLIYIAMTVIEIILLLLGGMPFFDSIVHSFGTAGTGGFGIKADSIASYSPYLQWVITVFMLLFALNFNLYYLILIKKLRAVIKNTEMWCFAGIVFFSFMMITLNIHSMYERLGDAVRASAFQVASIISTTGYATADFNTWPTFSKGILLILMIVGGCAGSTGGGLKVSRVVILFKSIYRELRRMLNPRSVKVVSIDGRAVDEQTVSGTTIYFCIYMALLAVVFILLCLEPFDITTNLSAALACFNNIGPGLSRVGPAANYHEYSIFSKFLLSFAMLCGRLEIFPLLLSFNPRIWKRKV